jgi:hypothetical protein
VLNCTPDCTPTYCGGGTAAGLMTIVNRLESYTHPCPPIRTQSCKQPMWACIRAPPPDFDRAVVACMSYSRLHHLV